MSKLKLEDFFTKTNHEAPVKLTLQLNGEDTEHYLMVLGSESRSTQRAKIDWSLSSVSVKEAAEKIKDKAEKAEFVILGNQQRNVEYSLALVSGWSFGAFAKDRLRKLLEESPDICEAVIAKAYAHSGEVEKK